MWQGQCLFHYKVYLSMHVHLCKLCTLEVVTFESYNHIIPIPVGVRAEVTADNTSIRVSWEWSCQGVLDHVRVDYRPKGDSLKMYTVGNTTATSATLPNLQCNTKYTIWVYVASGSHMTGNMSVSRTVSLPARGTYIMYVKFTVLYNTLYYSSPSHSN